MYMGIDVFGRITLGGGQWNVSANIGFLSTHDRSEL